MHRLPLWFLAILTFVSISDVNAKIEPQSQSPVIYGDDNRRDYFEITDPRVLHWADATVAIFKHSKFKKFPDGPWTLFPAKVNYGTANSLCETEPFYHQEAIASCSGFLVAPQLVATAGHCLGHLKKCDDLKFVFGWRMINASTVLREFDNDQVYSCTRIVSYKNEEGADGGDYAVLELDRPVVGHEPLAVRRAGQLGQDDELALLGYPMGLPLKFADGAHLRGVNKDNNNYLTVTADSYSGNSGSPVINKTTGLVEGILVEGDDDFEYSAGPTSCRISKKCEPDKCVGEDIMNIQRVPGI